MVETLAKSLRLGLLMLSLCAWPCLWAGDGEGGETSQDLVAANETCIDCHDDVMDILKHTIHTMGQGVSCIDCHGPSTVHVDEMEPEQVDFRGSEGTAERCLSCHDNELHKVQAKANLHHRADVFCGDCHAVHSEAAPPAPLLKAKPTALCLDCHNNTRAALTKPFSHRLGHGGMSCASCHDPHGGKGRFAFKGGKDATSACRDCHADKDGPFVFTHVTGFQGDCMTCHESHGSSNPHQLTRATVQQLCLECHSTAPTGTLGSQPPSTHNLFNPRYRDCTVCHTAIHGSSSSPKLLK